MQLTGQEISIIKRILLVPGPSKDFLVTDSDNFNKKNKKIFLKQTVIISWP